MIPSAAVDDDVPGTTSGKAPAPGADYRDLPEFGTLPKAARKFIDDVKVELVDNVMSRHGTIFAYACLLKDQDGTVERPMPVKESGFSIERYLRSDQRTEPDRYAAEQALINGAKAELASLHNAWARRWCLAFRNGSAAKRDGTYGDHLEVACRLAEQWYGGIAESVADEASPDPEAVGRLLHDVGFRVRRSRNRAGRPAAGGRPGRAWDDLPAQDRDRYVERAAANLGIARRTWIDAIGVKRFRATFMPWRKGTADFAVRDTPRARADVEVWMTVYAVLLAVLLHDGRDGATTWAADALGPARGVCRGMDAWRRGGGMDDGRGADREAVDAEAASLIRSVALQWVRVCANRACAVVHDATRRPADGSDVDVMAVIVMAVTPSSAKDPKTGATAAVRPPAAGNAPTLSDTIRSQAVGYVLAVRDPIVRAEPSSCYVNLARQWLHRAGYRQRRQVVLRDRHGHVVREGQDDVTREIRVWYEAPQSSTAPSDDGGDSGTDLFESMPDASTSVNPVDAGHVGSMAFSLLSWLERERNESRATHDHCVPFRVRSGWADAVQAAYDTGGAAADRGAMVQGEELLRRVMYMIGALGRNSFASADAIEAAVRRLDEAYGKARIAKDSIQLARYSIQAASRRGGDPDDLNYRIDVGRWWDTVVSARNGVVGRRKKNYLIENLDTVRADLETAGVTGDDLSALHTAEHVIAGIQGDRMPPLCVDEPDCPGVDVSPIWRSGTAGHGQGRPTGRPGGVPRGGTLEGDGERSVRHG
ncbi:hypothetical protein JS531_02030 [Bifidobacterium sp. CP2]|uniref:hypothetical protein n=1 Tax=Bifidobacterium sp. CP2 TaxID=2809025 RepID=UPI001BDD4FBB|nr:hypothetical protein [Bifidobacterium sp. CP2]MBT1180769.1 hypothetical protein [Bifidobacterium sp. CP2]